MPSSAVRATVGSAGARENSSPGLRLIVNNTRLLLLAPAGAIPNLATCVMAANLRRLSADWQEAFGHPPLTIPTASRFSLPRLRPQSLASARSHGRPPHPPFAFACGGSSNPELKPGF